MFGWFSKGKRGPSLPLSQLRGEIWIVQGEHLGQKWDLEEGEIVVGRGSERPRAINFSETTKFVSAEHARFWKDEAGYWIEDLGSKNGTYLNRKRLKARTALSDGDEVEVGQVVISVRLVPRESAPGAPEAARGDLEIVRGERKGERFSLDQGDLVVGRELEGPGTISLSDAQVQVSTEHAVFRKVRGVYGVRDLNSRNGTYVNGRRTVSSPLSDGDEVTIGDVVFKVRLAREGPAA